MPEHALVIGEALVDVVRRPDGTHTAHAGGSPANVAFGLARLGRSVELLTTLGDDAYGTLVRAHVESSGAIVAATIAAPRTSVATATLDGHGVATYDFDLEWALPDDSTTIPDPVVVHTGSIAAVLEPGASAVERLVEAAKERATITYDPNVRPTLMGDRGKAETTIERLVALADVVKVSDEDLEWLFPTEDPTDAAQRWLALGPALVVVTLGSDGALAVCAGGMVSVPRVVVEVADTVGAGDSFMSGLIDGLWSAELLGGHRRDALRAIDLPQVTQILQRCARIAGITVSRSGANPPTRTELGES
ncbi:carbohydrate kinase family protein [Demequina lutea]|uniref:Fructokinase n=1 Tax=Demequina lutea TaxID=431489 RepID=A0A7Y9ZBU5_9MICO|nr:carbohydrate kinase [Demequina lutea]NYI42291.1 fructokinase [Demequina lutea]